MSEVIVTATRRAENLQNVPIAVTAVSGEQLRSEGIANPQLLGRISPTFNYAATSNNASTPAIRIRGVGTSGGAPGYESAVGVFFDGVFVSRPGIALSDFLDVERLEVLRGPQGTLFGRNTSAGAISVITRKPDLHTFGGFADVSYGNYDLMAMQAAVNIPLIDDVLAGRLSASFRKRDGTVTLATGQKSNDLDRATLRGQLYAQPTDKLSIRFIADYSKADEHCCTAFITGTEQLAKAGAYTLVGLPANGGAAVTGETALEDRISSANVQPTDNTRQWGVSAEANWDLGFGTLTYIPAYRKYSSTETQDSDFVAVNGLIRGGPNGETGRFDVKTQTHELRLAGKAFDNRLDWLVGAYYLHEDVFNQFVVTLGPDYDAYFSAPIILVPGIAAAFGPNPLKVWSGGVGHNGDFANNDYTQSTKSTAFFTQEDYSLTDRLKLTLGLRYTSETKSGGFHQVASQSNGCLGYIANVANVPAALQATGRALSCFPFATPADTGIPGLPVSYQAKNDSNGVTTTAKVSYKFTPNVMAYVSYATGFKSGGLNLDATAAIGGASVIFKPEKTKSYEVGLKSTLFDNRMRANLAAWYMDVKNYQVSQYNGVQFVNFNVPKSYTEGVEVETLTYLTRELSLDASVTWMRARYPSDCAAGATPEAISGGVNLLCNHQLTKAPEWSGNAGLNYETDVGAFHTTLSALVHYEDKERTTIFPNVSNDVRPSITTLDLRAAIGPQDGRWTVELWGLNVTDEAIQLALSSAPARTGSALGFFDEPRTYGVTLRTKF